MPYEFDVAVAVRFSKRDDELYRDMGRGSSCKIHADALTNNPTEPDFTI